MNVTFSDEARALVDDQFARRLGSPEFRALLSLAHAKGLLVSLLQDAGISAYGEEGVEALSTRLLELFGADLLAASGYTTRLIAEELLREVLLNSSSSKDG